MPQFQICETLNCGLSWAKDFWPTEHSDHKFALVQTTTFVVITLSISEKQM